MTKTSRRQARRPLEPPEEKAPHGRRYGALTWVAIVVVAAGVALWLGKQRAEGPSKQVAPPRFGLPKVDHYHALLVDRIDARHLLLGTHAGLYESTDGGRSWKVAGLAGEDAMNLVQTSSQVVWAAGHEVLARSRDGGRTWTEVHPDGLPGRDVHGFAADPSRPSRLYAALAGKGLYRSRDGGRTFELASKEVGPNAIGLSVTPAGRILAANGRQGLLASHDSGRSWRVLLEQPALAVAVHPSRPRRIVATGRAIYRSDDGGATWRRVLELEGVAPVAWSPSERRVAYAVGDGRLYRSGDGGVTWRPVVRDVRSGRG